MRIGFIGLGRMGANMVRRLLGDGHEIVAYNRTPEKTREIATEGAEPWPLTPQQLDGLLVKEIERYKKAAKLAGIEPQ